MKLKDIIEILTVDPEKSKANKVSIRLREHVFLGTYAEHTLGMSQILSDEWEIKFESADLDLIKKVLD